MTDNTVFSSRLDGFAVSINASLAGVTDLAKAVAALTARLDASPPKMTRADVRIRNPAASILWSWGCCWAVAYACVKLRRRRSSDGFPAS